MKANWTILILLATAGVGCLPERDAPLTGLAIRQDSSGIVSSCIRDGYRAHVTKPTRATLTVQRTSQTPVVLQVDIRAGDDVIFGSCMTSFKTQSGTTEYTFSAQLRYAREDNGRSSSGGKKHKFFLSELPHGHSGETRSPLRFGETFLFSSHQCASNETIDLSIRFDELPNTSLEPISGS